MVAVPVSDQRHCLHGAKDVALAEAAAGLRLEEAMDGIFWENRLGEPLDLFLLVPTHTLTLHIVPTHSPRTDFLPLRIAALCLSVFVAVCALVSVFVLVVCFWLFVVLQNCAFGAGACCLLMAFEFSL